MENILEYNDFLNESKIKKTIIKTTGEYLIMRLLGRDGASESERKVGWFYTKIHFNGQNKSIYYKLCFESESDYNSNKYLYENKNKVYKVEPMTNDEIRRYDKPINNRQRNETVIYALTSNNLVAFDSGNLRKDGMMVYSTGGDIKIGLDKNNCFTIYLNGVYYPASLSLVYKIMHGRLSYDELLNTIKGLMIQEIYKPEYTTVKSNVYKALKNHNINVKDIIKIVNELKIMFQVKDLDLNLKYFGLNRFYEDFSYLNNITSV
jgi:hypothetical protein